MRMWNVKPELLCRKHLVGEHGEMHMFKGAIEKGKSIEGFLTKGFVNIGQIKKRHDELAKEMLRREYNHLSPMKRFKEGKKKQTVDVKKSLRELSKRCKDCRRRIAK